jgi:exoribonuclease R
MLVPSKQVPDGFFQRPQDFSNFLFVATIFKWDERSKMAQAKLLDCLGKAGDIKAESDAILISTRIDMREFPDEILNSLPIVKGEEWKIDEVCYYYIPQL